MNPGNFQYRNMSYLPPRMPMPIPILNPVMDNRPQPSWHDRIDWANMTDREYSQLMSMQQYYWQGYSQGSGSGQGRHYPQIAYLPPPRPQHQQPLYHRPHVEMQPLGRPYSEPPVPATAPVPASIPKYIPPLMGTPIPRPTSISMPIPRTTPTPIPIPIPKPTPPPLPMVPSWVRMPLNMGADLPVPLKKAMNIPVSTPLLPPTSPPVAVTKNQSKETDRPPAPKSNLKGPRLKTRIKYRTPRIGRHLAQAAIFRVKTRRGIGTGTVTKKVTSKPGASVAPDLGKISEWPELPAPLPPPKPVVERPWPLFARSLRTTISTPTTTTTSTPRSYNYVDAEEPSSSTSTPRSNPSDYDHIIQRVIARLEDPPTSIKKKSKQKEVTLDFSKSSEWPALPGQDEKKQENENASCSIWSTPPRLKTNVVDPLRQLKESPTNTPKHPYVHLWASTPISSDGGPASFSFGSSGLENSWNRNDWTWQYPLCHSSDASPQESVKNLNLTEISEWPPLPVPGSNSPRNPDVGRGQALDPQRISPTMKIRDIRSKDYYFDVFTRAAESGKEFVPSAKAEPSSPPPARTLYEYLSKKNAEFIRGRTLSQAKRNDNFNATISESENTSTSLNTESHVWINEEEEEDASDSHRGQRSRSQERVHSWAQPKKEAFDLRSKADQKNDQDSMMRCRYHVRVPTQHSNLSSGAPANPNSSTPTICPQPQLIGPYYPGPVHPRRATYAIYTHSGKPALSQSSLKFKCPSRFTLHEMKHNLRVVRLKGIKRCGF